MTTMNQLLIDLDVEGTLQSIEDDLTSLEKHLKSKSPNAQSIKIIQRVRHNVANFAQLPDHISLRVQIQTVVDRLITDLEVIRRQYHEEQDKVTKLQIEIEKLRTELEKSKSENADLNGKVNTLQRSVTGTEHSALRRTIAINIEYEVKYQMLVVLGEEDPTTDEVSESKVSELFHKVKRLEKKDAFLESWFGENYGKYNRFADTMGYLKDFSYMAHPTELDGDLVDERVALELINEDFVTRGRKRKFTWDELKADAKVFVEKLAQCRKMGEQLLYN